MFNNYFKSSCIAATFCLLFNNQLFTQQNLVPNPSFEQYSNCPNRNLYLGTGNLADIHKIKPDIWYKPDFFWGGYFNACANTQDTIYGVPYNSILYGSYQYARTGEGYLTMFYLNKTKSQILCRALCEFAK
ncbi:MAG: hypothetical protein NTZ59_13705 [Bacteroidetes bacterium]|nr:hypothetical protein [Bacteroidota bacterium]